MAGRSLSLWSFPFLYHSLYPFELVDCSDCGGSAEDEEGNACDSCDGDGTQDCSDCSGSGSQMCNQCDGDGYYDCSYCNGNGEIETDVMEYDENKHNIYTTNKLFVCYFRKG